MSKTKKKLDNSYFAMDTSRKMIIIRHAKTFKNEIKDKKLDLKNIDLLRYLDDSINDTGKRQAEKLSEFLKNIDIEDIYVSPLYRTLQTAFILFKNHPQKNKIILKINPLIMESFRCNNSFISDFKKSRKEFNEFSEVKFDWTYFDKICPTTKDKCFYFLNWVDNEIILNYLKTEKNPFINLANSNDFSLYNQEVQNAFKKFNEILVENKIENLNSINILIKRFEKFKNEVREEHKKTLQQKNKKIIVVSHCWNSRISQGIFIPKDKKIYGYPEGNIKFKNCEFLSIDL